MKFDFAVLDLLNWIRRWIWNSPRGKSRLYQQIKRWSGLLGNLHLIERDRLPGEPAAIATFVWFPKRDRAGRLPLDLYLEIRRSRIAGYSHELAIVEAEHTVFQEGFFRARPVFDGVYNWVDRRGRSTKRRNFLISQFEIINQFEQRDRDAVLIAFAVVRRKCQQHSVNWGEAIAEESSLILGSRFSVKEGMGDTEKLKDGSVKGIILD